MKIEEKLKELEGWSLIDGQLVREFIFDSFLDGINFIEKVSEIAEEENHHPDIDIRYNKIICRVMSHDIGAITDRDFLLAGKINHIV